MNEKLSVHILRNDPQEEQFAKCIMANVLVAVAKLYEP
jgi:hypothetical protein